MYGSGDPVLGISIILPIGISFFTFQAMSYTIDVYRRNLEPITSFTDFALFIAFFPQLVAGPIVRAVTFLPQLGPPRRIADVPFRLALGLFLIGFIKKACISDVLAPLVDRVFDDPTAYTAMSHWIATLFFAAQIYCDFSGYTDMAIAVASLLGFTLNKNFNFPYLAGDITLFWRRWHISLSSWLRDYLYISLGGNRGGKLFTYRNLMLTMLLGGLWHGAAWTFVIWGGLHGLALIFHRLYRRRTESIPAFQKLGPWIGVPLTFYWVCICWIFFRADSFSAALTVLKGFTFLGSSGTLALGSPLILLMIPLFILHVMAQRRYLLRWVLEIPDWGFAAIYAAVIVLILPFIYVGHRPFIYFQF
jgi:alginate O-acetyltransferase complex protein AlgI